MIKDKNNKFKTIYQLFKPYIVKRNKGQWQILLPLIELDWLINKITDRYKKIKLKK